MELHGYGDKTSDVDYMTTSLVSNTSSSVRRSSRTGFLQSPAGSELSNVSSKSAKKCAAQMRFDNEDDVDVDVDVDDDADDDDNHMSSRDGNDSGDDVQDKEDNEEEDDECVRYDNDTEHDDDGGNNDDEGGNNDSDDDDDYQPEESTGKGQLVYATAAEEIDDDTPLVTGQLDDGSQNGLYPVHQVCAMTKQQIDAFALKAIMKEVVLPHVKFIANGDARRDFLKYTHNDTSLCQLVLTHSGQKNASGNKSWWKQMSSKIRHALANYRNNTMNSMKRAYTGKYNMCVWFVMVDGYKHELELQCVTLTTVLVFVGNVTSPLLTCQ